MPHSHPHYPRSVCRKLQRANSPASRGNGLLPFSGAVSTQHCPRGFTLTELLVVIGILAMLTAILTPVVFQARASAKNAAIKAEIDMLHMAIMHYKNEYGSFPPCTAGSSTPSLPVKHLRRIFPRVASDADALAQLNVAATGSGGTLVDPSPSCRNSLTLSTNTALVFWLEGFTSNPQSPLYPGSQRQKIFDFDETRKLSSSGRFTGEYHAAGKSGATYAYVDALNYPTETLDVPGFNPDSFQIICAGADEQFGTDDDLSNFWKGTRKEYLDSLQ